MKFVCGTLNKAKIESVKMAVSRCKFLATDGGIDRVESSDGGECDGHERHEVIGVNVPSGVGAQPFSAAETRAGALARAKAALLADSTADFGIGLEGGVEIVQGDSSGDFFECGWIAVVSRSGRVGWGSSARFLLDASIIEQLKSGLELAQVMDAMTGETDVRSNAGAMGVLTGGALSRAEAYAHGVIFAFAPFLSGEQYWKVSRVRNVVDLQPAASSGALAAAPAAASATGGQQQQQQ